VEKKRSKLGRNVIGLGAVSLFTDVSTEMIYPLLPIFLAGALGANASFIGAIEGAAETTASLLKLLSGWWSDRIKSRKPFVVIGYLIASIARPFTAMTRNATQVLAIRLTDRVGKGLRTSPRDALLADSAPPEARGLAYGFHAAADNTGAVLGPLIAFLILKMHGVGALDSSRHLSLHDENAIRNVFWLSAIPAAIAMVVLILVVKDVPASVCFPRPRATRNWSSPVASASMMKPRSAVVASTAESSTSVSTSSRTRPDPRARRPFRMAAIC